MDKVMQILLDALRQAAEEPAEQRLYRSGKLAGLFPGRTGANAEAAARALRDGLLEVVRTETKGKTTVEWARLTPKGVEFLHGHESPVRALDELRAALEVTREGVPAWVADLRRQLEALGARLEEEVQKVTRRLDALGRRVGEALERAQGLGPRLPQEVAAAVPWGPEAVGYLERRRAGGVANDCPMPELFAAVREKQPELLLKDFHAGLKKLHDRGLVRLVPFEGNGALLEPECALLDGSAVYYHVTR
jgi:hypothetical protein